MAFVIFGRLDVDSIRYSGVSAATVKLTTLSENGDRTDVATGTTGADGSFKLEFDAALVSPTLIVTLPTGVTLEPKSIDWSADKPETVVPDIVIDATGVSGKDFLVRGRLVNGTDGVMNASITLLSGGEPQPVQQSFTDSSGAFRLEFNTDLTSQWLSITLPTGENLPPYNFNWSADTAETVLPDINIGTDTPTGGDTKRYVIRARVVIDSEQGAGLPGALAKLRSSSPSDERLDLATTTSSADGSISLVWQGELSTPSLMVSLASGKVVEDRYFDASLDGLVLDFGVFVVSSSDLTALTIAGNLTLLPAAGDVIVAENFKDLEISAECDYYDAPTRILRFVFSDVSQITGATAPFSLTQATKLYANGLSQPITVRVRGFGMDLWTKDYAADDSALANLEIKLQKPTRLILTPSPASANRSAAKKLRGRVLTLSQDCSLKDVLVVVQAKAKADDAWRTVGAATTDASGNFALPYPYGAYVQARAIVSLSAEEIADIPCAQAPNESISDDFLYLLLTKPDCSQNKEDADCGCEGTDKPNRLPDHSDLIGSDEYSQDIGGSCVNLSKPNRTISEFAYKAIVRASDPDVANYTLTRIETGLDDVDISLSVGLSKAAAELLGLTNQARAAAVSDIDATHTAFASVFLSNIESLLPHVNTLASVLTDPNVKVTASGLGSTLHHADTVIAILSSYQARALAEDFPQFPAPAAAVLASANRLRTLVALAIDSIGSAARYELTGGTSLRRRAPVSLSNPIAWQDDPETVGDASAGLNRLKSDAKSRDQQKSTGGGTTPQPVAAPPPNATFSQAVTAATGHILHYKAVFKSDGYSLGDLLHSLPLAPGQKKEIVVFESSHTLVGAESQTQSQNERLALGLISDRDISTQLAGRISESMRGSSSANTSGISAGFGTAGQGYGGTGAYGGSGGAVIGIAGGVANANSVASQDSSRNVAEFFGEKLRQSIMQNAEGYRQLNASVVSTVQEGQRYGVTSEVVANHNHCHALTMMYFEVLRHYAIFQELSSVEECVFVPLLLTRFTTENVARWRDVLAPALLPLPSETYLKPIESLNGARSHPLLKAFDADQRIRTHYANVDMPAGSYDDERIKFLRGSMRLRVSIPRPRTRYDRIMSLPITKQIDTQALTYDTLKYAQDMAGYAAKVGVTAGFYSLFEPPPNPPNPAQYEVVAREAIFDSFMKLDANYASVPPAQCIRVVNFKPPPTISLGSFGLLQVKGSLESFFAENAEDRDQWQAYADLLGYKDVLTMLNAHFKGNLISEWDNIFYTDIAPLVIEKILNATYLEHFTIDLAPEAKYRGGERYLRVNITGTTSQKRNELPDIIKLAVSGSSSVKTLKSFITLSVQDVNLSYSTSHYTGTLFSGTLNDDLLDGTQLFIPESSDEKRNPKREDRYLAAKLNEHLNSHLEYYNKVLWANLDPDRRYMLLDGFTIQIYGEDGTPITTTDGMRSLASIVKNEVVAIAGNSLVMPVAPGYRVNGSFVQKKAAGEVETVTLFDHYKPLTPPKPFRISVPSKGVFAEAVQGVCNACEKIETDRLQDWNRFPNTDEPTPITPITTPTPALTDWRAAFKEFATPIVNIQNAPALPAAGEGLANLGDLLGRAGVFKDITGLDANQQNVIRTYLSNQENAKAFAEMAKEMAMQQHNTQNTGKIMDQISSAKRTGDLSTEEASKLVKNHLQQQIDGGAATDSETTAAQKKIELINGTQQANAIKPGAAQALNEGVLRDLIPSSSAKASVDSVTDLLNRMRGEDVSQLEMNADGGFKVVNASFPKGASADSLKIGDYKHLPIVWAFRDLIAFAPPTSLVIASAPRGLAVQRIEDGYGDVNLDQYTVRITKLPNDPQSGKPFEEAAFFEHVRRGFARYMQPYPATGLPESLAPWSTGDATSWASGAPLGSVLQFTIDPQLMPDAAVPFVAERGLVLCSEYASVPSVDHHWRFSTLTGPNPAGYHPVSGTRQFGLKAADGYWVFYVRAADRMGGVPEWVLRDSVYSGQAVYWKYFQTTLKTFVDAHGGSAEIGSDNVFHFDWESVQRIIEPVWRKSSIGSGSAVSL